MRIMDTLISELNAQPGQQGKFTRLHSEPGKYDSQNRLHRLNGQFAKETSKKPFTNSSTSDILKPQEHSPTKTKGETKMTIINKMTAAELKKTAKELKVKDWWKLNKAELITACTARMKEEDAKLEKKAPKKVSSKKSPTKKAEPQNPDNVVTLKEICSDLKIKGTKARRILRNNPETAKAAGRWEWDRTDTKTINLVKSLLK